MVLRSEPSSELDLRWACGTATGDADIPVTSLLLITHPQTYYSLVILEIHFKKLRQPDSIVIKAVIVRLR